MTSARLENHVLNGRAESPADVAQLAFLEKAGASADLLDFVWEAARTA